MHNTIFAAVNGKELTGSMILRTKKRLLAQYEENDSFALTPNDENNVFLNAEALQKLIEIESLLALARFEGLTPSEENVSTAIVQLRSEYEDEAEWESVLHDMGLESHEIRNEIQNDLQIDMLFFSRLENFDEPSDEDATLFYEEHQESMKMPDSYTFLEMESPDQGHLASIVSILSQENPSKIAKEAAEKNIHFSMNDDIPYNKLPEELQNVLSDLEEQKIGTLQADDGSFILIKLLSKKQGNILSLEEALPGLKEYLKIRQHEGLMDELISEALEKCDIVYHNDIHLKLLK